MPTVLEESAIKDSSTGTVSSRSQQTPSIFDRRVCWQSQQDSSCSLCEQSFGPAIFDSRFRRSCWTTPLAMSAVNDHSPLFLYAKL
jgi:hypothetical protein